MPKFTWRAEVIAGNGSGTGAGSGEVTAANEASAKAAVRKHIKDTTPGVITTDRKSVV